MCCNIWYHSQACLLRLQKNYTCFHWNTVESQAATNLQSLLTEGMPSQILYSPLAQEGSHSKYSEENVNQIHMTHCHVYFTICYRKRHVET